MTYPSWERRHRVATIAPGKLDLFVLTLINGRRASLRPVTEYDAALSDAQAFHRDHQCQIKVLAVTWEEASNLVGFSFDLERERLNPADRDLIRGTLTDVIENSSDTDARSDALKLLLSLEEARL